MLICNIVAVIVALDILDQGLKVEVWQLVHNVEHDVFEEFVIDLGSPRHHLQVASMLGKASVQNCKVLIICVNDRVFEPLVVAIPDETLTALEMRWAVHLAMTTEVWAESSILPNRVLHERTTVVHL